MESPSGRQRHPSLAASSLDKAPAANTGFAWGQHQRNEETTKLRRRVPNTTKPSVFLHGSRAQAQAHNWATTSESVQAQSDIRATTSESGTTGQRPQLHQAQLGNDIRVSTYCVLAQHLSSSHHLRILHSTQQHQRETKQEQEQDQQQQQ